MPKVRKTQVSIKAMSYYHCISLCVRRAFLCGKDSQSSQNYEYRRQWGQDYGQKRQWIEDRLLSLYNIFAIDISAYAIMNANTIMSYCISKKNCQERNTTPGREEVERSRMPGPRKPEPSNISVLQSSGHSNGLTNS